MNTYEKENRFVLENANEAILVLQDWRFVFINPKALEVTKYTRDELIGLPFYVLVHPDDRQLTIERYSKRVRGEPAKSNYPIKIIDKNEEVKWVELNAVFFTWKGRPAVYDFLTDITEQKRAEERLKYSEGLFRTLVENTFDIIAIVDHAGIIKYVSPAAENILRYSCDELINTNSFDLIHRDDLQIAHKAFSIGLRGEKTSRSVEFRIRRKDASWVIFEVIGGNLPDDSPMSGLVVNLRDISERKTAENNLRESEERLRILSSQLISMQENERKRIAGELHDSIGQSLTSIKLGIENACEHLNRTEKNRAASILQSSIPMIQDTMTEIRKIVRDLRPSILDDLGIIATIGWFIRKFKDVHQGITVETKITIHESEVPNRLKIVIFRILQETFNNISKHSNATHISLTMERIDETIRLVIRDNGVGFDSNDLYLLEASGLAFGVTSMRERTRLSNGVFSVRSKSGEGTEVSVSWPTQ